MVSLLSETCSDGQRGIGGQTAPPTSMTGTNNWLKMVSGELPYQYISQDHKLISKC